jgi:hypothetical protein
MYGEDEPRHVLADPSQIKNISYEVLIDEPWNGEQWLQIQRVRVKSIDPEQPTARAHWIDVGWRDHGGVQVKTRSGETIWVLTDEQQWATKAVDLAQSAYAEESAPQAEVTEAPAERSSSGPGFLALYWPHLAIGAGALALAAAALYYAFKPRDGWTPLRS